MTQTISAADLGILFTEAHTHTNWLDKPVDAATLKAVYDLARFAPTSANTQPGRYIFITSKEAKERLKPALAPGNVDKTMAAPVTVIVAHDMKFYENLPKTFPQVDARSWFVGNDALIESTAVRNGTLQGGYLILAARALGLDAGPMSGFDNAKVDAEFFPGGRVKSNFLINLGHGDPAKLFPRNPRLDFDEVAQIL
jgi:3-hydroxypropanoate dehydrogenase